MIPAAVSPSRLAAALHVPLHTGSMCTVSNLGDTYTDRWRQPSQPLLPYVQPPDIDALRREVQELKRLIENALELDAVTGQRDCAHGEKFRQLAEVADTLGIGPEVREVLEGAGLLPQAERER